MFGLVATVLLGRLLLRHAIPRTVEHTHPTDPPAVTAQNAHGTARPGGARRMVAVFGLIALCTAYGEGALAEWGPLHLQEDLHTGLLPRPPDMPPSPSR